MAEHNRLTKAGRPYRMRARAAAMDRTRERITRVAVELHGTIGPAATTMSAVAELAGVTRATLYRHFPNEVALFMACSTDWLAANPRPDPAGWAAGGDPGRPPGAAPPRPLASSPPTEPTPGPCGLGRRRRSGPPARCRTRRALRLLPLDRADAVEPATRHRRDPGEIPAGDRRIPAHYDPGPRSRLARAFRGAPAARRHRTCGRLRDVAIAGQRGANGPGRRRADGPVRRGYRQLGADRLRPLHQPELDEHAKLIGHAPVLDHLAALEADDIHDVDFERLASGRKAHDRAGVHASGAVERPDGVPLGCDLDDVEFEVREPVAKGHDRCLRAFVPSMPGLLPRWCSMASGPSTRSTAPRRESSASCVTRSCASRRPTLCSSKPFASPRPRRS